MMTDEHGGQWCASTAIAAARAVAFIASAPTPEEAADRVVELAVKMLGAASGFLCGGSEPCGSDPGMGILDLQLQGETELLGRLVLLFDPDLPLDEPTREAGQKLAAVLAEGLQAAMVRMREAQGPLRDEARRQREWTSIIAHDLRQPLSLLALQIGMLRRHRARTGIEPMLSQMLRATQVIDRMISDLLETSQLDAHGLSVRLRQVDLSQLLQEFSTRAGPALTGRRLIIRGGDAAAPVRADAERIEQVLWNLVSNAVKYGRPDAPVEVHLHSDAQGSRISVRNEGKGITKSDLARLFRRFERLNRTGEGQPKGLGLGLYIAQGLIRAHGGRIWAESKPDVATYFHIWLPAAEEQVLLDDAPSALQAQVT